MEKLAPSLSLRKIAHENLMASSKIRRYDKLRVNTVENIERMMTLKRPPCEVCKDTKTIYYIPGTHKHYCAKHRQAAIDEMRPRAHYGY